MDKRKILIAPLNWGLGHATRCIPIIKELIIKGFEPVLASDGEALHLLQKEFPLLKSYTLPSYNISYARNRFFFGWKLLLKTPHILKTVKAEKVATEKLVKTNGISGIISDNRWGVRSTKVQSVFITHQVKVLSGLTTFFSSKIQQKYIRKFDECWVPDVAEEPSLSGKMGHTHFNFPIRYLGILSRFEKKFVQQDYDLAVILSGPEPQRSLLEEILLKELKDFSGKIIMVRGVVEDEQEIQQKDHILIYNFMTSEKLENVINGSNLIICRPGYTSLIDLAKLEKKLFVIPTPGQYEQEYLAKRLSRNNIAGRCRQQDFSLEKIYNLKKHKGFRGFSNRIYLSSALTFFEGK